MDAAEVVRLIAALVLTAVGAVLVAAGGYVGGSVLLLGAVGLCFQVYRNYR